MRARLELWTKDQGGRHTPIFDNFRPGFRAGTDEHGDADLGVAVVKLPADQPMLMPGTAADVDLEPVDASAWSQVGSGLVLGVFEATRQIGTATVLSA
jgi:translation elongation factor EF-Tu-like GTPase